MTLERERLAELADPEVESTALLLGNDASELLGAVLSHAGARIESVRPAQVSYAPRRSLVVQYVASVVWDDGLKTDETLVASAGVPVPDEVPRVKTGVGSVAVWRYPHDPFLPGLALAANPERISDVLQKLGAPYESVRLRRRAYRPGRRAVIEAIAPNTRIYVKIVRPERVEALQANHRRLVDHVPIPQSYGWSKELGLVAMQALPGRPLRRSLESGSRQLPDSARVVALLDMLGRAPESLSKLKASTRRVQTHATLLSAVMPELSDGLNAIVEMVRGVEPSHDAVVHGDFHSSQILTKGTSITGLIDVDTAGMGNRADDLATLLGHISTLSLNSPSRKSIERYGSELIKAFDRLTNPKDLRLRTAAVVLGFATGPFRVQQKRWVRQTHRRVTLAEKWVRAASELA